MNKRFNLNQEIVTDIDAIEKEMQEELAKVYRKYRPKTISVIQKKLPKGMSLGNSNGVCFLYDKNENIATDGSYHTLDEETSHNEHNQAILQRIAQLQYNIDVDENLIDMQVFGNKM